MTAPLPDARFLLAKSPEESGVVSVFGRTLMDMGTGGAAALTVFPLERAEMSIGRVEGNDIRLDHATVSRKHARVYLQDGAFWIEDLGSANGVRVNGIDVDRRRLATNDQVKIGKFTLVYAVS